MLELVTESGSISLQGVPEGGELVKLRARLEADIVSHAGQSLTIDLSALAAVSSQLLSLLLCCLRCAESHSCRLQFKGMSRGLFDMARVGGVEAFLPLLQEA